MLNRRHHIHLICDSEDSSLFLARDKIAVFFEQRAFFTKDLILNSSDSANYSWRCIDNCDYVIVVVGKNYGTENNSGVSQLHVSYLNAKTKNKPIVALLRQGTTIDRKLADLVSVMEQQLEHVYHFEDDSDFMEMLHHIYDDLLAEHPSQGWVKSDVFEANLKAEISHSIQNIHSLGSYNFNEPSISSPSSIKKSNGKLHLAPSLQDELMVSCTAHAFRGGNLAEVAFMASINWRELLMVLVGHKLPFSQQGLWRKLNDLVTPQALSAIQLSEPDVHAISRCQVTKADMLWVYNELLSAGWIAPADGGKNIWQTTDTAKNLVDRHS